MIKLGSGCRPAPPAFYTKSFMVGSNEAFTVGMEDIPPPLPVYHPNAPTLAVPKELARETLTATLAGAMSAWSGRCAGGDRYNNNCAHFLADAFIRARLLRSRREQPLY